MLVSDKDWGVFWHILCSELSSVECIGISELGAAGGGVEDQHQVDAPLWQGGDRTHLEFDIYSCYRCFTPSTGRPSSPGWGGKARSRRKRRRIRPGSNKHTKQLWEKSFKVRKSSASPSTRLWRPPACFRRLNVELLVLPIPKM